VATGPDSRRCGGFGTLANRTIGHVRCAIWSTRTDAMKHASASSAHAILVSGDVHLTSLASRMPVRRSAEFLADLEIQRDDRPT
jgi:hypothetical protein